MRYLKALPFIILAILFFGGAWLVPYTPGNRWGLGLSLFVAGIGILSLRHAIRELRHEIGGEE